MEENQQKLEQNQREKPMSILTLVVITGLFGGIFWSSIGYVFYLFHFTEIRPNVILEPWAVGDWKTGGLGTIISIIIIGLLSIGSALVYYVTLKKFNNMWAGILFGAALFGLVFILLNPLFPSIKPFMDLERNTIITSICLFVVYGVFVGYSISYEVNELKAEEQKNVSH